MKLIAIVAYVAALFLAGYWYIESSNVALILSGLSALSGLSLTLAKKQDATISLRQKGGVNSTNIQIGQINRNKKGGSE